MAVTASPSYPVVGDTVTLSMTSATGTSFGFEVVAVPARSALAKGLLVKSASDDGSGVPLTSSLQAAERGVLRVDFLPDAPGEYVITGYDMRQRVAMPRFVGDPASGVRYELLGSQQTTIHIGAHIDLDIVTTTGDGGTLRLQVNDLIIRAASVVNPRNEKSRVAALDATVVSALAALIGQDESTAGPAVATTATELRTKYEAHRVNGVHTNADATNVVARTEANSIPGAIELAATLRDTIVRHLENGSTNATPWHKDGVGITHDDFKNLPVTAIPTTLPGAVVALADLRYRVYERHRVQVASPAVHTGADNADSLAAATLLDAAIVAYLDALVAASPTIAQREPKGAYGAEHLYGFRNT